MSGAGAKNDYDSPWKEALLRLLDWFLPLSEPEEIKLREQLAELKPEKTMPFVTSFERYARLEGRQEGRQEGLRQAVHEVLTTRFGPIPQAMTEALEGCTDTARLQAWLRAASTRSSLSEVAAELAID